MTDMGEQDCFTALAESRELLTSAIQWQHTEYEGLMVQHHRYGSSGVHGTVLSLHYIYFEVDQ